MMRHSASPSILITPRALTRDGHPALSLLEQAGYELHFCQAGKTPSEDELITLLPHCVGWLAGVEPVSEKVIAHATQLRAISRNGTGVDNLPCAYLEQKKIAVLRAEGANARGVAELAIALMMSALRHIPATHTGISQGEWPRTLGKEIENRPLAVMGYGRIGHAFCTMAAGLGAKVRAYDPYVQHPLQPIGHFSWYRDLSLLDSADILSLHAPGRSDGKALIGQEELARLSKDATVINTARASLIDQKAMLNALENGQVGMYACDVFEQEPPVMSELLSHPHVLMSSHIGGYTEESVARATYAAVENLLRALREA